MNKAFEKILERLDEERELSYADFSRYVDEVSPSIDAEYDDFFHRGLERASRLVKEVAKEYNGGWIPCSDRLPEERDWYLAVFEEVDTGFIGLPYIADYLMGEHTIATTEDGWIIRNCTDREDESAEYYKNLRCVAWQPLPEPYKEE